MKGMSNLFAILMLIAVMCVVMIGTAAAVDMPVATTAWMPKEALASCTTIGPSRAGTTSVTVKGVTRLLSWKAFNATDGTAVVVKRKLATGNTAYMPMSSEGPVGVAAAGSPFVFERYSGATTITICTDKN